MIQTLIKNIDIVVTQKRDVVGTLAQGRNRVVSDIQTIEQVFTETVFLHHLCEIFVCRSDDAHIDFPFLIFTDSSDTVVFQRAQEFAL